MSVTLLRPYQGYIAGATITLQADVEQALVTQGIAVVGTAGGAPTGPIADANNSPLLFTQDDGIGGGTGAAYVYIDNTPAKANFAIGSGVPYVFTNSASSGHDNLFIGLSTGELVTTGIGNLGIGHNALGVLTTGLNNLAIGWDSQFANVIANNNVSLGEDALKYIGLSGTSADNNVGIGYRAGYSSDTSIECVFLGNSTGDANVSSDHLVLIGHSSGSRITDADNNTMVGYFSGRRLVTGTDNTALGYAAMGGAFAGTGTSSYCVAIGSTTLQDVTTGVRNTAVGGAALNRVTTGANNTAVGYGAGNAQLTASGNVFLGYAAGFFETGSNTLLVDNAASARTNEATARLESLIVGHFNATITSQDIGFNVGTAKLTSDGSGAYANMKTATTVLSPVSGASVTATNLIPAKAFLVGVSTRITTVLTGATGFTVGDGSDVDRFGVQAAATVNGTTSNADATADPTGWASAARSVVLTASGSNFTGGVIRVTAHYIDNTAPSV